jgi:hypothetical protein
MPCCFQSHTNIATRYDDSLASPFLGRVGNFGVELGAYEVWVWHFDGGVVLVAFEEIFKALIKKNRR